MHVEDNKKETAAPAESPNVVSTTETCLGRLLWLQKQVTHSPKSLLAHTAPAEAGTGKATLSPRQCSSGIWKDCGLFPQPQLPSVNFSWWVSAQVFLQDEPKLISAFCFRTDDSRCSPRLIICWTTFWIVHICVYKMLHLAPHSANREDWKRKELTPALELHRQWHQWTLPGSHSGASQNVQQPTNL